MRKTVAAVVAAGSLLAGVLLAGIGAATPALAQSRSITLLCSPGSNGAVDTFTITNGSLPPGLSMPATYGAAGTIVGGTPTGQGTFTFTVHVTPFGATRPSVNGTYSIAVGSAPPLTITFPSTCCSAGTVGSSYFQNFFTSGGTGPFTWTVGAGQLPPGVVLTGNHLGGTPTTAGTFTFTIKVTDSAGNQATEAGSITISP